MTRNMKKSLSEIIKCLKPLQVVGDGNVLIHDVICDSRKATEGVLFVAINGVAVDAHKFIPDVVAAGAAAIVCETLPADLAPSTTYVVVKNTTIALPLIADQWFDHPSRQLRLVGVTDTNGKTSIATLLYTMAEMMGFKAGLI